MRARDVLNRRVSYAVAAVCFALASGGLSWILLGSHSDAGSLISLGDWMKTGGVAPWVVTLGFQISESSALCLCAIAVVVAVTSWRATAAMCVVNLACLLGACIALFATDLVVWWCGWVLTAVFAAVAISTESRSAAPLAGRRFLTAGAFLDLVLLLGIATVWIGFGFTDSSSLVGPEFSRRLQSSDGPAIVGAGAFYLIIALLARPGVFPFLGWTNEVSGAGWRVFCSVRCGLFLLPMLVLLERWQSLWMQSSVASQLLEGLGVLTVLIGGAVSLVRPNPVATLNGVMSGFVGLVLVATSLGSVEVIWIATGAMPLFVATTIVACESQPATSPAKSLLLWVSAGLLLVTLNLLVAVNVVMRFEIVGTAPIMVGSCVGGMLATIAVMRVVLLVNRQSLGKTSAVTMQPSNDAPVVEPIAEPLAEPERRRIAWGLTVVGVLMMCVSGASRHVALLMDVDPLMTLTVWFGLLLFSSAIGWLLFAQPSELPAQVARGLGPLARLSRQGFYIDDAVFFLLTMPLRGLAQAGRLMDWMVVEGIVVGLPAKYPQWIARIASPLRSPSANLSALSLCLGLGVMLVVVVWIWG
ncbi:MAG: hypothetical protein O3A00_22215 [Planctomycetota bacterium]|nr:hypothetical protein [Planctomycetota bacterium]